MKVFLLHPDRDFAVKPELREAIFEAMLSSNPFAIQNVKRNLERERERGATAIAAPSPTDEDLTRDLGLESLWAAMAAGDDFLYETAKRALLSVVTDAETILFRQQVLADCLDHPDVVRELYELALEALEHERKAGSVWSGARPHSILHRSVQLLGLHLEVLRRLRRIAVEHGEAFRSDGFRRFFAMVREELADDYLASVERELGELELKHGVLETARLGKGLKGREYVVRAQPERSWSERLPFGRRSAGYTFQLHPRDENGFKALEEIRGKGLNQVANAVAQSADHVGSFFTMLRLELAFYLGCLNLDAWLRERGRPVCFPEPLPSGEPVLAARGLYDVSLALHLDGSVVANDVDADGKSLIVITGANQGGKSTFLRSVGLAQLMMQAGMFVGAESLRTGVCSGIYTHYKREEDAEMEGGKLDEELRRMSEIARRIAPGGLLLCNESFASTNEREGSEIARQVVRAMLDKRIRVVFVTHMYDLAHGFQAQRLPAVHFLRAQRGPDGGRTFKLVEGPPLPTSYGVDSYRRIFGEDAELPPPEELPESRAAAGG